MRKLAYFLAVALFAVDVGTGSASARAAAKPRQKVLAKTTVSPLVGVYYGNGRPTSMGDVEDFEAWQGKRNAVLNFFTSWDPTVMSALFGQSLPAIWANNNVPMITWEPFTGGGSAPSDIEVQIGQGNYDEYVRSWAEDLKQWLAGPDGIYGSADDRRAYLRLAHEMNGNWYPWSAAIGKNSPAAYVSMWRRVHGIFTSEGLDSTRLQWVWSVNRQDVGGYKAEEFYPGDAYVDWTAVDGYNRIPQEQPSGWRNPNQVFDNMLGRLRKLSSRPVAITETASTSITRTGVSVTAKSAWITNLFNYVLGNRVQMVIWFNQDKTGDWAVFGGVRGDSSYAGHLTYNAYRQAIVRPQFQSSDVGNPRLLSDYQFAGH